MLFDIFFSLSFKDVPAGIRNYMLNTNERVISISVETILKLLCCNSKSGLDTPKQYLTVLQGLLDTWKKVQIINNCAACIICCFCITTADIRDSQVLILVKRILAKRSTEGVIMLSNQNFTEGCVFSFSHIHIQTHTHTCPVWACCSGWVCCWGSWVCGGLSWNGGFWVKMQ